MHPRIRAYNRVINIWNQLDQRAVGASSINAFIEWLNKICIAKKMWSEAAVFVPGAVT